MNKSNDIAGGNKPEVRALKQYTVYQPIDMKEQASSFAQHLVQSEEAPQALITDVDVHSHHRNLKHTYDRLCFAMNLEIVPHCLASVVLSSLPTKLAPGNTINPADLKAAHDYLVAFQRVEKIDSEIIVLQKAKAKLLVEGAKLELEHEHLGDFFRDANEVQTEEAIKALMSERTFPSQYTVV